MSVSASQRKHDRSMLLARAAAAAALLVLPLSLSPTTAQVSPADQPSVYVRDSAIAADKFELGKRMERLKEWHTSADVYQEILEKFQDRVVPTQLNDRGIPVKYASVTVAVQERLAKWPEEGLAVYRQRHEPNAAAMYAQIRRDDYAALHEIFSRYFATDTARDAGIRLIDLYLESGEFAAAAWTGDRLLQWHPNLQALRASVLFRTALGYHLAGNTNLARRRFEELKDKHPADIGVVAGKDAILSETLASLIEKAPPRASVAGVDSYPTIGGGPSRNLVPAGVGIPGSKVWSVPITPPLPSNRPEAARPQVAAQNPARSTTAAISIIPAVDRGELFFQDGQRIRALQLETGVPLPGWVQTYGGRQMGQYTLPNSVTNFAALIAGAADVNTTTLAAGLARQQTVTVTDDSILAVLGLTDPRAAAGGDSATRLVCLDRTTGKARWVAAPRDLPKTEQFDGKGIAFSGAPLVVGENVYIIGRGAGGAGVEDCNVICYDLASGKYRWASYIASAQSGAPNINGGQAGLSIDTLSHLAFSSGRVFVMTNLGAVAAVDAYSGATAWLSLYPRDESTNFHTRQQMNRMGGVFGGGLAALSTSDNTRPWEFNPVVVHDGRVFALPTDGKHLIIYDAATGDVLKIIQNRIRFYATEEPRFDDDGENYRITMILGVVDNLLVVAGGRPSEPNGIFFLDYEKLATVKAGETELTEDSIYYLQPLGELIGRPFLTATHVFAPTEVGLMIIDIKAQRTTHRYPRGGSPWPDAEGPGNVIVTGEHVIIADERNINVYTDIEGIRQKYETAMKADPNDVEARLVFAELMFNAREFADARKSLDDAIKVLGGLDAMREGPLRDRVFGDALMFAQKLGAEKTPEMLAVADELFDRAAAAAQNPSQHVNYRVTRARFIESLKGTVSEPDYTQAVKLYQEILSSPDRRIITLSGEDGVAQQAGTLAENAIHELKLRVGPNVYATFEKEAAEQLANLREKQDPAALLTLAENYPNAEVAREAVTLAADAFEKTNQPRMATQVLRRAYLKYGNQYSADQKVKLSEAMARNYLKIGNVPAALGRLHRALSLQSEAKLSDPPLMSADGKPLSTPAGKPAESLSEAVAALQTIVEAESSKLPLPDVKIPDPLSVEEYLQIALAKKLPRQPFEKADSQPILANVQAMLRPPSEYALTHARHDRVVLLTGGKLACYRPGAAAPEWTSSALADPTGVEQLLWIDQATLAVWSDSELALLDGESGKTLWKIELKGLPGVDYLGPEDQSSFAQAQPDPAAVAAAQAQIIRGGELARRQMIFPLGGMGVAAGVNPARAILNMQNGAVPNAPANNDAEADGIERILHVRPLSDRLILSTTTGRLLCVTLADGKTRWQTRIVNGPGIQQTLATEDFAAVRTLGGSTGQLVVLDSFSGQQVLRRAFNTSQNNWVMNAALSPDGTLVWTSPQQMFAKDLYDNDDPHGDATQRSYVGMTQTGQLLIHNQEVFAVADGGGFIDRRSLRGLRPIDNPLGTGGSDANTRIRIAEGRLYVASSKALIAYHLKDKTSTPILLDPPDETTYFPADLMITRSYLLLPGTTSRVATEPGVSLLNASSRELFIDEETGTAQESGLGTEQVTVPAPRKVHAWQPVEGGLCYLTTDGTFHFLKGTKTP